MSALAQVWGSEEENSSCAQEPLALGGTTDTGTRRSSATSKTGVTSKHLTGTGGDLRGLPGGGDPHPESCG